MKRVLIVEDDEWLADQFAMSLKKAKYEPLIVHHALGAIQQVDIFKPDVMIMDVLLTGGTAFTLMNELQTYCDTGAIPIVLCTNSAKDLNIKDLIPYGVRRMLDKTTMVPEDIVVAVRSVL